MARPMRSAVPMLTKDRLKQLRDATVPVMRGLDSEARTRALVQAARGIEAADAAALMLRDDAADALVIVAQDGLSKAYAATQRIPMDRARAMYRGPDVHVVIDLASRPLGDAALVRAEGLATVLAVPIVDGDELIGALSVYAKDPARSFDEADIEAAHVLAALAAASVLNTRAHAQVVEQRELLRALFDELGDGVIVAQPGGTLTGLNRTARDLIGLTDADLGLSLTDLAGKFQLRDAADGTLVSPTDTPLARALAGDRSSGVYAIVDPRDGARRELEVNARPVPGADGGIVAAVATIHDLTEIRRAEHDKEQFLSIVSHELRTPLTPLKALAQLLRSRLRRARDTGTPIDEASFERNLAAIERQVDRMNNLVNDLLSVSRAERGTLRKETLPFDLSAVVRDVAQRYVAATEEEGRYRFSIEAPAELRYEGDPSRVEQLLLNLIGNAVKYSPNGGAVRVVLEHRDGQALLTIADDGIGILPEDLPLLGAPYVRGTGRAATFAGTGVGLYVAKLVAEAHGGSLALESEGEGKGTTVRVRLPLS